MNNTLTSILKSFDTLINSEFVRKACGDVFIEHLINSKYIILDTI